MIDTPTSPDKPEGSKQLTNKALMEMARPHAVRAIERLAELMESKQEAVAVSAAKVLLAKVLPDLKAMELTGEDGKAIKIDVSAMLQRVYGFTPIKPDPTRTLPENS